MESACGEMGICLERLSRIVGEAVPLGYVGPIYGLILTAWGSASAFGPLLIAHLRQTSGSYASGLHVVAGVMALSILLPILIAPPKSGLVSPGDFKHQKAAGQT